MTEPVERAERAKTRMAIAAPIFFGTIFGVIVLGVVLYLVLR